MSETAPRPSLLANLILFGIVGAGLFVCFMFIKGCGKKPVVKTDTPKEKQVEPKVAEQKPAEKKAEPPKKPTPADEAKAVAAANELRAKQGPAAADPAEQEKMRQVLRESTRKPFSQVPPEYEQPKPPPLPTTAPPKPPTPVPVVAATTHPPAVPPTPGPPPTPVVATPEVSAPPAPEPVREVTTASPEGAALLSDATARIDEAPAELYSEKAKIKVREGLKAARRIFKVHTVYFEKGGAVTQGKDVAELTKSLENPSLQDAMNDPRSVFFVLGFADKTGTPETNKKLSTSRADAVIALLRDKCGVLNLTYPVAVGSTEIVAPENKEKNRAAEVWLVLP
jgi:outer membrane protein OmpA-like peptidoglycan-associated protein